MAIAVDRRRRGAVDWTAQPPRQPSFSPDIYIGSDGRAHVDTRHGIDGVYFLSAAPHSYTTSSCSANEVKQYVTGFAADRAKVGAKVDTEEMENAIDEALDKVAALVEAEAKVYDDLSVIDDTVDDDDSELDIFASQTRTWRTVLKRRERAAIQQTQASLTYLLSNSDAWQMHLLINATIRKVIRGLEASLFVLRDSRYSPNRITCAHPRCPLPSHSISTAGTAYLSLETVHTDALSSLLTTPGIQVADDIYIPIYIRGNRTSNDSTEPNYGPPTSAMEAGEQHEDGNAAAAAAAAITVHATFCISCVRDLYAGAVAPSLPQPPTAATASASAIDSSSSSHSSPHAESLTTAPNTPDSNAARHQHGSAEQGNREDDGKLVREPPSPSRWAAVDVGQREVDGGGARQAVWPPRGPRPGVGDAEVEDLQQLDGAVYGGGGGGGKGQGSGTASGGVGCVAM